VVVSTHLKNISQNGNLPQVGLKKNKNKTTTQLSYIEQTTKILAAT